MKRNSKAKDQTPSLPMKIFDYMKEKGTQASRQEIAKGIGLTNEQVRKAVIRMAASGVLITHEKQTDSDVDRYTLHPEAKVAKAKNGQILVTLRDDYIELIDGQVPEVKEEPKKEERAGTRGKGTGEFKDGDDSMFEYQRGYQNGYNDAISHSQKDAYQAGKRVVIEGLLKLLKVDAKVLMA